MDKKTTRVLRSLWLLRGAKVTLVSGPVNLEPPMFVEIINVESAEQMYEAVTSRMEEQDIIIKSAAVADYRPAQTAEEKVKKKDGDMSIPLVRTQDILQYVGQQKRENQIVCGFSMETENMLENSKRKLEKKNIDLIVANNLKVEGAGFGTDTNIVTIISKEKQEELPIMSKEQVANQLLDTILHKNF